MAFTVTPTSGDAPYLLEAVFSNSVLIDNVNFSLSVKYTSSVGSCPAEGSNQELAPSQIQSLLNNGSFNHFSAVSAGSCRTYTLTIKNIASDDVVDSYSVSVDNV